MSEELKAQDLKELKAKAISQPLVEHIYTADPSAHVFDGRIYIYPSHDIEAGIPFNDNGDHFGMQDYHVLSLDGPGSPAVDHGVALDIKDVPWAERQMWAPDAARKDGKYYFYFPAKKPDGIFQIGVAVADSPIGPFKAQPQAIAGSYSIDPAVLKTMTAAFICILAVFGADSYKTTATISTALTMQNRQQLSQL